MFTEEEIECKERIDGFRSFTRFCITGFIILFALQTAAMYMNFISVADRREIHENERRIEQMQADADAKAEINKQMLKPRAIGQIKVYEILWDKIDGETQQAIIDGWKDAQYDVVKPAPKRTK